MKKDVANKIILITGGASGIGKLMAFAFAEKKARVVIWDINNDAIKAVEDEAAQKKLDIKGMTCDISSRENIYSQAKKFIADFGPADILINNAGIVSKKPANPAAGPLFLSIPDEAIARCININTLSLFWMCKAFLPDMVQRDSGHIVNIASAAGIIGVNGLPDYCASKFAAFGFNESLRMELKRNNSNIQTTIVCPFFIDTGMFAGVRTRVPFLLPILKKEYAAERIVSAVLNNKKQLIMPRFVYSVFMLRLMPAGFFDWAASLFGISHAMDDFKGRT